MKKLYHEDSSIKEFTTTITDIQYKESNYHVLLKETAFFPGGGGQFCDLGYIDDKEVIDVYEKGELVYHVMNEEPTNIIVKCRINWDRREDGMNQHLAQHIISGCFYTLFKKNTKGFHLGKDFSTIDIEGYITKQELKKVEQLANEIINQNIQVQTLIPGKEELSKLWIRRDLPETNQQIRIVKIGELDINACCGVHPKYTKEVQIIKLCKVEKNRGNTRIEYLAGKRAVDYILKRDNIFEQICIKLKSNEDDSINMLNKLYSQVDLLKLKNKEMEQIQKEYEKEQLLSSAKKEKDIGIISKTYNDIDNKKILNIISDISKLDNYVLLIGIKNDINTQLIFSCSKNIEKLNMNELLKNILTRENGKGGGSKNLAQGFLTSDINTDLLFENIIRNIEEYI